MRVNSAELEVESFSSELSLKATSYFMKYAADNLASLCFCIFSTLSDGESAFRVAQNVCYNKNTSLKAREHVSAVFGMTLYNITYWRRSKIALAQSIASEATCCEATPLPKATVMEKQTELHCSAYYQKS